MAHGVTPGSRDVLPASFTVLPSAARTASVTSDAFSTQGASGLIVVIDVTAVTASPAVTLIIEGVVYPSGNLPGVVPATWTIWTGPGVGSVGTSAYRFHPSLPQIAGVLEPDLIPDLVRVSMVHSDADPITYSVSGILTP